MCNKIYYLIFVQTLFILIIFSSCQKKEMKENIDAINPLISTPPALWDNLAKKKIYFAHQSVGYNIIDGVKEIIKKNPHIHLNIIETTKKTDLKGGFFAHSKIGQNKLLSQRVTNFLNYLTMA